MDVFLSHNSEDKAEVRTIAEALVERGLKVWLDEWELRPGIPWQNPLEEAIKGSSAVAVLVGLNGIGPWEEIEMRAALMLQLERGNPVIPIALPGMPREVELPLFLRLNNWVSFESLDDKRALELLWWGITGEKPRRKRRRRPTAIDRVLDPIEAASKNLVESMRFGNVTYFVGPGAFGGREFPPGNTSLARQLLAKLELIEQDYQNLLPTIDVAASCFSIRHGDRNLEDSVVSLIMSRSHSIPAMHRTLADLLRKLAARPRTRTRRRAHQLIITTNFDVLLERALVLEGVEFTRVVQHRSASKVQINKYLGIKQIGNGAIEFIDEGGRTRTLQTTRNGQPCTLSPTETECLDEWIEHSHVEEMSAADLTFSNLKEPILYKHQGSQDVPDSCVISAEHCLDFSRRSTAPGFIPIEIGRTLAATPALFLGHNPLDPDFRLLYHTLLTDLFQTSDRDLRYAPLRPAEEPCRDCYQQLEKKLWNSIVDSTLDQMRIRILAEQPDRFLRRLIDGLV